MTREAFRSQLAVSALAAALATLAEALGGAWPALRANLGEGLLTAAAGVGLWFWPALLGALLLAALLAERCDDAPLSLVLREQWREPLRRDVLITASALAALLAGWVFGCARAVLRFHNLELAAALLAALVLLGGAALAWPGWLLLGWLRRRPLSRARVHVALGGLMLLTLSWLIWSSRAGLRQLAPQLLLAPLVFALVFVTADLSQRVRAAARWLPAGLGALGLLFWASFMLLGVRSEARASALGSWSALLIGAVQRATDVDADGYSSLLGGGDCAAFDANVNPGAPEIAGDGIDNNCIAGDAGKSAKPQRPRWGAAAHGAPTNLNVVIVTIETLRADHVSFMGSKRDTTPQLAKLAREALVFERMYSAAPLTRLALATLFSSHSPSEIDWLPQAPEQRMRRIGPQTPWLPELLSARGYDTIAILTDFSAFGPRENAGFERGFRSYDTSTKLSYRGGTMWGFPAAEQVDKAIAYVEQARRPFLLWLHLFEPHYAYEQPPDAPHFGDDEQARYDAEIWHVDAQLGRLFAALRRLELWDSSVVFVSGDHGEAFGEHADRWHGSNLFDPQLRPAALLRVPGVGGKRITQPVTFSDVAPTLTRLLGDRQSFDQLRGRSLTPLLHHARLPEEDPDAFIAESFSVDDGHGYQAALVKLPLKLIYVEQGRRFTLFDLAADPRELEPLDPAADPRGVVLLRELAGYLERARPRPPGAGMR